MRMSLLSALTVCALALLVTPVKAQAPVDPYGAQIASLRKELQRQRKSQVALRKDLQASRQAVAGLERKTDEQHQGLDALRQELARTWGGGAAGLAVLFFLLLIIAFRRPRGAFGAPDELQQRLAALDRRLRDLTP